MLGRQYTGFRGRMLGIFFLFFSCVYAAAPVIKAAYEEFKQATSLPWTQNPNPSETEEESHLAASYINQPTAFNLKKQEAGHFYHRGRPGYDMLPGVDRQLSYIRSASFLPRPAYYNFLFRYNPF